MRFAGKFFSAGAATVVAVLAACSGETTPVSAPVAARGDFAAADVWLSQVHLCKFGPAGTNATFSISATGGHLLLGNEVTVNTIEEPSDCTPIWEPTDESTVTVTVTEIASTPGTVINQIMVFEGIDGFMEFDKAGATAWVRVNPLYRGYINFKNIEGEIPPPPPPPATQGCTPGYWKQSQHFDSWPAAYTPNMSFDAVFADAFPGMTLLQVVGQGGGGLKALGRHTVAALLNAGNADVQNGLTTTQVIAAFNAAFASGDYETQKNIFEGLNELGCPLN